MIPVVIAAIVTTADSPQFLPGFVQFRVGQSIRMQVSSKPVSYRGQRLKIVNIQEVRFKLDHHESKPDNLILPNFGPDGTGPVSVPLEKFSARAERESKLKAILKAWVTQFNQVDYRISCAVFDKANNLLGTASQIEHVDYVRLGQMPMMSKDIELDFGSSKSYSNAAYALFSISEPVVPSPPEDDGG